MGPFSRNIVSTPIWTHARLNSRGVFPQCCFFFLLPLKPLPPLGLDFLIRPRHTISHFPFRAGELLPPLPPPRFHPTVPWTAFYHRGCCFVSLWPPWSTYVFPTFLTSLHVVIKLSALCPNFSWAVSSTTMASFRPFFHPFGLSQTFFC